MYTNSVTGCSIRGFELYKWGNAGDTGCHDENMNGYTTNNGDYTASIHHYAMTEDSYNYCFRAFTKSTGSGCVDNYVYASFSTITIADILIAKTSPMGDQTFNYDAATSSFSVTGANGFKEFFDVISDIENDVTC